MLIDVKDQIISFEKSSDGYVNSYPFKLIYDVQESDFSVGEEELEA